MKLGADLRTRGEKAMKANVGDATAAAVERLELCFLGPDIDWTRFYRPVGFGRSLIQFIEA